MERVKQMQENHYGQYTEIQDEKEVIRITACVLRSLLILLGSYACL